RSKIRFLIKPSQYGPMVRGQMPGGPRAQNGVRGIAPITRFPANNYTARAGSRPNQSIIYKPGVRNPLPTPAEAQIPAEQAAQPKAPDTEQPLNATILAAAPPQEQKQLLGERLYPSIRQLYPELCGKITGMLLEIENSELLAMLDTKSNPGLLQEKVQEAVTVLTQHRTDA
ncbi:unnamed protein product, partial [Oikopleura dioica]